MLMIDGALGRRQYEDIAAAAESMLSQGVSRVGVVIDSGGGELPGLDGAVRALVTLREAVGGQLWTYTPRSATSAACALLLCAGRGRAFASAGARVGSLAAFARLEDSSQLWREGLLTTVHEIKPGGDLKVTGGEGVEITAEQIEHMEEQVGSARAAFLALTAAARGVSTAEIARMAGEGGTYDSSVARTIGLIDGVIDFPAWRAMVAGAATPPPTQEMDEMPTPAQPAEVKAPESATQAAEKPPTPAAEPAVKAGSDPPAAAAPGDELRAMVRDLTAQVTSLAGTLAEERRSRLEQERTAKAEAAVGRVRALAGRSITPTFAAQAEKVVRATVAGGGDVEEYVRALELSPPVDTLANLTETVTFSVDGTDVSVDVNAVDFGFKTGADGKPVVDIGAARETAALIHGANKPQDVIRRLEAAFRQDGRF
jgi:ClpP class serine protease